MPLKHFQAIKLNIHFVDNNEEDGNSDCYFKVRPLLDSVRDKFLKIEEERKFSLDEMMIPCKGTRAGSRCQYVKKKPHKWSFKVFIRAGISGMIYDFLVYGGA